MVKKSLLIGYKQAKLWNIEHIDFICAQWKEIVFDAFPDNTEIKLDL